MLLFPRRTVVLALLATSALLAQHTVPVAATTESSAADQATLGPSSAPTGTPIEDNDEPGGSMTDCNPDFMGDGSCDDSENNAACNYDGGDCCSCTCVPDIYRCGGNFDCIDPDAVCVDDDDGDGGVMTTTADIEDEGIGSDMGEDSDSGSAFSASSFIAGCAAAAAAGFAALSF